MTKQADVQEGDLRRVMVEGRGWFAASASCCRCIRDRSSVRVRVRSWRACSSLADALTRGWLRCCLSTAST